MTKAPPAGGIQRLIREPLFHFLGLALLLFLAHALFSGDQRELITVDSATRDYLIQQRQDMVLRDLNNAEKQALIDEFIDEEILVREARKRGFENSSRIRTLLIQNMRFFMAGTIPEPTQEELKTWFEANPEQFASAASTTYDHAHFNDPQAVPPDMLDRLRGGENHRTVGDTTSMTSSIFRAQADALVATFGRQQAPVILAIDDTRWHGPFSSDQGVHFLRVAQQHEPQTPHWEEAQSWIGSEWLRVKNLEIMEREMAQMRRNYRIETGQPAE